MPFRCFQKLAPKNPVRLPNGKTLKFGTVDNVLGYFATEDVAVQQMLEALTRQGEFGLSEIPDKQFHEYLEKKRQGVTPLGREEFAPGLALRLATQSAQLSRDSQAAAVKPASPVSPVVGPPPGSVAAATAISQPATLPAVAPTAPEFAAPVGKRTGSARRKKVGTPAEP